MMNAKHEKYRPLTLPHKLCENKKRNDFFSGVPFLCPYKKMEKLILAQLKERDAACFDACWEDDETRDIAARVSRIIANAARLKNAVFVPDDPLWMIFLALYDSDVIVDISIEIFEEFQCDFPDKKMSDDTFTFAQFVEHIKATAGTVPVSRTRLGCKLRTLFLLVSSVIILWLFACGHLLLPMLLMIAFAITLLCPKKKTDAPKQ